MQAAEKQPEISLEFPSRTKARKKPKQVSASFEFANFIIILIFLGLAAFVHVYQQALVAQNGIDISRLKDEIFEETRKGKGLKVEKMLLQSPSRIGRLATDKLDMIEPEQVTYIVMPPQTVEAPEAKRLAKGGGSRGVLARIGLISGDR